MEYILPNKINKGATIGIIALSGAIENQDTILRGVTKLKELGYDRYITIERELDDDAQLKEILKAKDYFEKLLAEL